MTQLFVSLLAVSAPCFMLRSCQLRKVCSLEKTKMLDLPQHGNSFQATPKSRFYICVSCNGKLPDVALNTKAPVLPGLNAEVCPAPCRPPGMPMNESLIPRA